MRVKRESRQRSPLPGLTQTFIILLPNQSTFDYLSLQSVHIATNVSELGEGKSIQKEQNMISKNDISKRKRQSTKQQQLTIAISKVF